MTDFSDIHMDIIFVANTKDIRLRTMTQHAIDTCRDADRLSYHFYVVEQNRRSLPYKKADMVYYDFPFNYHRCLNLGVYYSSKRTNSPFIALCNTDLIFANHWGMNITYAMSKGYLSASPSKKFFNGITEGYKVGNQVLGWCIVVHRSLFEKIGKLNEAVSFWYSDNIYADQLKAAGVKHILVGTSNVNHLVSQTTKGEKGKEVSKLRHGQKRKYIKERLKLLK